MSLMVVLDGFALFNVLTFKDVVMMLASKATRRFVTASVIITRTSCLEGFQSSWMSS